MEHNPHGETVHGGKRYHTLWRLQPDSSRVLIAAVEAILMTSRATPTIEWFVAAPERMSAYTTLVVAKRWFPTEGDAMDALLRLEALAMAGELPSEIRDVI